MYNEDMRQPKLKSGKSTLSTWKNGIAVAVCVLLLTGCQALPIEIDLPWFNQTLEPSVPPIDPNLNGNDSVAPLPSEVVPTEEPAPVTQITLWLRPELDPKADTPAGRSLRARLDLFSRDNQVEVVTRIKAVEGIGGLLDSLRSAHSAAPHSLPDLVMVDREQLLQAVSLDLVYPLEAQKTSLENLDWYPVGASLSTVESVYYGTPICFNPMIMAYDSATEIPPADEWADIVTNPGRIGFAADDPDAKFMTLLYFAAGGTFTDEFGRPQLEAQALTQALLLLEEAEAAKHISSLSLEFQTEDEVWDSFTAWNINKAIVPISFVLNEVSGAQSNQPKPALTMPETTLADGMLWMVTRNEPQRMELAEKLLEALSEPSFLSKWSADMNCLPARSSAVTLLEYPTIKLFIERIAPVALPYPDDLIVEKIGPVLHNAMRVVLQDGGDPAEVAAAAVESVR